MERYNAIYHLMNIIVKFFLNQNFNILKSSIITNLANNFHFLRIDQSHPSFNHKDTFFIDDHYVLRTHTSNFQKYFFNSDLSKQKIFKYINYGTVFRKDDSSMHSYFFHQLDGLMRYENYNTISYIIELKNIINQITNQNNKYRIRKSYFPFTNPSFELDIYYQNQYIEILGCGMTHFEISKTPTFAFGLGIERMAMILYKINNIKKLRMHNV